MGRTPKPPAGQNAETMKYPTPSSSGGNSQGTSRSAAKPGGPEGFQRSASATGYSRANSQGTTRSVGGGRSVASTGHSGSMGQAPYPLVRNMNVTGGPRGRAQQASEAGWVPGAQGPTRSLEAGTGRSGGRAAGQREREGQWGPPSSGGMTGVQVGNSFEKAAPPKMPGTLRIGDDKNVSTPVSG